MAAGSRRRGGATVNYRRAFTILLLLFLLIAAAWAGWGAYSVDLVERGPEPLFRARTLVLSTLSRTMALLPVVAAAATVVTLSVAVTAFDLGPGPLLGRIGPIVIWLVVLGVLNAAWVAILGPAVHMRLDHLERSSEMIRTASREAEAALGRRQLDEAMRQVDVLLAIDPANETAERVADEVRQHSSLARDTEADSGGAGAADQPPRAVEVTAERPVELIARARRALEEEDFFTAYYFSGLVPTDDPLRMQALEIRNQARRAIERDAREITTESDRVYFSEKRRALNLLEQGEVDPVALVEAFYLFQELRERRPRDPDVQNYLQRTRELIARYTFFIDDAQRFRAYPGTGPLFFVNRSGSDLVEIISIDNLVATDAGTYLYGVEIVRLVPPEDAPGDVAAWLPELHLRSRYGMVINRILVMRAIERAGASSAVDENVETPTYHVGSPDEPLGSAVALTYAPHELVRFAGGSRRYSSLSLAELLAVPAVLVTAGASPLPAWRALAERLVRMAGFFVVAFVSIAAAWRFRSMYLGRPPMPVLLVVPLLPLLIWGILQTVRAITAAGIVSAVPADGGAASIFWVVGGLVAAIVVSVALAAVQRVEP